MTIYTLIRNKRTEKIQSFQLILKLNRKWVKEYFFFISCNNAKSIEYLLVEICETTHCWAHYHILPSSVPRIKPEH